MPLLLQFDGGIGPNDKLYKMKKIGAIFIQLNTLNGINAAICDENNNNNTNNLNQQITNEWLVYLNLNI